MFRYIYPGDFMTNAKIIEYEDMKVTMRKDFYSQFHKELKEFFEESGCNIFGHNIIKNYRVEGHEISTFTSNEKWHELYWDKFRNDDPVEKICNNNALKTTLGVISWNIIDPNSECNEQRLAHCDAKDGFSLAYTYPNGFIENVSFGWGFVDKEHRDLRKILKLAPLIMSLRQHHINIAFKENDNVSFDKL